jgi:hypothetical protein
MSEIFKEMLRELQSRVSARADVVEAISIFGSTNFLSGIGVSDDRPAIIGKSLKTSNLPMVERMSCRDSMRAGERVLSYCKFESVLLACECEALEIVGPKAWLDTSENLRNAPCWAEESGNFKQAIRESVTSAGAPECWMSDDSCRLEWDDMSQSEVGEIGVLRVSQLVNRLLFHLCVTIYAVGKDRLPITLGVLNALKSGGVPCGWIGETEYSGYRSVGNSLCSFHLGKGGTSIDHPWEPAKMRPRNSQMGRIVLRKKIV